MSKKVKILIAVSLAALLLVAGIIAVPVLAEDTPTPTPPVALVKHEGIMERTAKILNISADSLINAENQTRQELWQKPENNTRPTPVSPDDFYNRVAQILGSGMTRDKLVAAMQQAAKELSVENLNNQLDRAVQNGKITQDEENQIKDWIAKRPSAVDKLFNSRLFGGLKGWGWGRCWGGFGGMGGFGRGFKNVPKQPNPTVTPNTTAFFPGSATSSPTY